MRPTGVYGLARPPDASKWFDLVSAVVRGQPMTCQRGGEVVHARDAARAAGLLLKADGIAGEAYNCCDRDVSEFEAAAIAKRISGSASDILGRRSTPKHQIETGKLQALGMIFGGAAMLGKTIAELVESARR